MKINQRKAGVILSYAGQLTKILISIIYTPIMLRLLGQSEYGLYQLVYSVVSYLSLLSLGFSSSYMRFYSRYKAQRDEDGVARLNGMFLLIFTSLSIVCVLCGCVMLGNIKGIFGSGLTDSEYQEERNAGKLKGINFRCKDNGWSDFGMKEVLKEIPEREEKKLYIPKDKDAYMQMFLRNYCLRPSCYECIAKKENKSDLTIADFWGIEEVAPEMSDGMGTSLALIRTDKGAKVFEKIKKNLKLKEVTYEEGVRFNPAEYKSCVRPSQRNTFFHDMRAISFDELEKKYAAPVKYSLTIRTKRKIKHLIKSILQVMGGGTESDI